MKALTFAIQLLQPVLATQPMSGEPNSAVSYPFIPGSMLRGALIQQCSEKFAPDLSPDSAWRNWFLDGGLLFLNACLSSGSMRLIPRPLSWFCEKENVIKGFGDLYDFAMQEVALEKARPPVGEYVLVDGNEATLFSPARRIQVHNASTDRNRKVSGSSQVFRYDALAAGQVFRGAIVEMENYVLGPDGEQPLEYLRKKLSGSVFSLGGSNTGGYGLVKVVGEPRIEESWQEYEPQGEWDGNTIVLTLLSDVILPDTAPGHETLAQELSLSVPDSAHRKAYFKTRPVGGFNRTWGLPLPQACALAAGSVFCFSVDGVDLPALIRRVERGIGLRTAEGFGRAAVNWQGEAILRFDRGDLHKTPPEWKVTSSRGLAQKMAERLLRRKLEDGLADLLDVSTLKSKIVVESLPSKSQLSRLRLAARTSMQQGQATPILAHLASLKRAKKAWQDARIDGKSLFDWVEQLSRLNDKGFLDAFGLTETPPVAGERSDLNMALKTEFCGRWLDGVMKFAVEQVKEREEGRGS